MAHLHCDFSSDFLGMNTAMNVVLPEKAELENVKVIYLFHGLMDNCSGWTRYTSVERYARMKNAALVIPEVQRSYYTDMALGVRYFSYVSEELPEVCRRFFGLSAARENNFVMGLSMGGYGALKCAFTHPERYAGAASFSAVTDMKARVAAATDAEKPEYTAIFGPELHVQEKDDLFALACKAEVKSFPRLMTFCGEQDALFGQNVRFAELLTELGFDESFAHWAGGHEWPFWDEAVRRAIDAMLPD